MALFDTLISVFIIVGIFLMMYSKISKKSILEIFIEIKDLFQTISEKKEEVKERIGEVKPRIKF